MARRSISRSAISSLLALAVSLTSACSGDDGGGSGGDYGERSLGPGVVSDIESDGRLAYLGTRGLFTPIGELTALDGDARPVWTLTAPDSVYDVMVGEDGLVYVATPRGSLAATRGGEWTAFDGARGGLLGWHPWGLPMAAPPSGGLAVMDARGDLLLEAWTDWIIQGMAVAADGAIYAFMAPGQGNADPARYVVRLDDRFEPVWNVPLVDGATGGGPHFAVNDEMVVVAWDAGVQAWNHDGSVRWAVQGTSGPLLIDGDTTYIAGNRLTAVSGAGEILWDRAGPGYLTLTDAGLIGMVAADGEIRQTGIDRATGESTGGPLWSGMTDVFAPVVVGGRTVAAAHVITGSSYFPEAGGIVVEQGSETFVDFAGPGGASGAIWPDGQGPGGRRSVPVRAVRPDEGDLFGLWVAREGPRARAIELTDEAWDFGLSATRAYGIYDYDVRQPPRLIEVGTWSYDGAQIALTPEATATEVELKNAVEVYDARPGTLRIDDPAQDLVRTFRRARRLPAADALVAGADRLGWLYGEGARDGDVGVAILPAGDGVTVVSAFDYIGRLGGETYTVTRRADGVDGRGDDRSDNLVFDVTPDGMVPAVAHNQAPGFGAIGALALDGDATRAYGPFTIGTSPELVFSAALDAAGGQYGFGDVKTWGGPDPTDGSTALSGPTLWAGGALYVGTTGITPATHGEGLVVRVDDDGQEMWRWIGGGEGSTALAAVGLEGGEVAIVGDFAGELDVGGRTLRAPVRSTYIARLDGDSGQPIDGYRIAGRLFGASLTATPDGGLVMAAQPYTPFNGGTGRVHAAMAYNPLVFSAYGPELEPRWTRTFDPDPAAGVGVSASVMKVDPFGTLTVGGRLAGDYRFEGVPAGRADRTTAVWQFDRCGTLLWQRRFNTFVTVRDVAFGDDGTIFATGGFMADLFVPPWVALFSGGFPDVATGFAGGTDTLVFTLEGAGDRLGDPVDCRTPPPPSSIVRVELQGQGTGRVVSDPPGIDCPGQCEAEFTDLTELTLTAVADDGSAIDGFAGPAGCNGLDCALLVSGPTEVDAWFDAAAVDFAVTAPGLSPAYTRLAVRGDRAAVGIELRDAMLTLGGEGFPTPAGYGVLFAEADGRYAFFEVPGSRPTNLVGGIDLGPDGAVAIGGASSLMPEALTNAALVVLDPDGTVRWSRALQSSPNSAQVIPAFGNDRIALLMPANGSITIDDETVDAPFGAVALFDAADGALLALRGINGQAEHILWTDDGRLVVWSDRPLFSDVVPELPWSPDQNGRWFLVLDADLEPVDLVGWRFDVRLPLTMNGAGVEGTALFGWTDDLRPAWSAQPGGDPTWPHPLRQTPDGWMLGNVDPTGAALPGRLGVGVRLSAVRLDPSGRARTAWTTADADDVVVHGLGADGERVFAIVEADAVRGPDGSAVPGFIGRSWALVGLRIPEVAR